MKRSSVGAAKRPAGSIASKADKRPSSSAAQPAKRAGTGLHASSTEPPTSTDPSATHPAEQLPQDRAVHMQSPHRFRVLRECCDWLQTLPQHVVSHSPPLQRVRSVTALVQMPAARRQRQEIQSLLVEWGVPQWDRGKKRNFDDVKTDLVSRVVEETNRLKTMHDAARSSIPAAPASSAWPKYSAIQAALQKETARHQG